MSSTNGGLKVTRADVDRYAVLKAKADELSSRADALKDAIKAFVGPDATFEGYLYMVDIGKAPEITDKVDYRKELIKALGKDGAKIVSKMEDEASATVVDYRSPSLKIKVNPDVANHPELAQKSKDALADLKL